MPSLLGAARQACCQYSRSEWSSASFKPEGATSWPVRLAFAPFEGSVVAATYVLLVLIASRFYLMAADRLTQA